MLTQLDSSPSLWSIWYQLLPNWWQDRFLVAEVQIRRRKRVCRSSVAKQGLWLRFYIYRAQGIGKFELMKGYMVDSTEDFLRSKNWVCSFVWEETVWFYDEMICNKRIITEDWRKFSCPLTLGIEPGASWTPHWRGPLSQTQELDRITRPVKDIVSRLITINISNFVIIMTKAFSVFQHIIHASFLHVRGNARVREYFAINAHDVRIAIRHWLRHTIHSTRSEKSCEKCNAKISRS